jgi:mono/diheme cytochrome c family protein
MRKALRIAGKALLGLVGLIVLVVIVAYGVSSLRLKKRYAIAPSHMVVPADPASISRGQGLAALSGCTGCHAANLGGQEFINGFPFAKLATPNLTRGRGGVAAAYSDADWERAIRHGVRRNGDHLMIMPSAAFNQFRDEEVGQIIAYVKSVPPVDGGHPARVMYPLSRVLHAFGAPLFEAEKIDHTHQVVVSPPRGATVEWGKFLAQGCQFCHGDNLKGKQEGGEPGAPPSPDISRTGEPGRWTEAQFIQTIRTGTTPAGRYLVDRYMPWSSLGRLGDDDLRAVYMYLQASDSIRADSLAAAAKKK